MGFILFIRVIYFSKRTPMVTHFPFCGPDSCLRPSFANDDAKIEPGWWEGRWFNWRPSVLLFVGRFPELWPAQTLSEIC